MLGVPGFYSVGLLLASNVSGFPHAERLVAIWMASWMGAVLTAWLFGRLRIEPKAAVYSAFVLWIGIMTFGGVVRSMGLSVALLMLGLLVAGIGVLTHRAPGWAVIDSLVVALAVTLLAGPVIEGVESVSDYGETTLESSQATAIEFATKPDIWLLVVDGYPSATTLEVDLGVNWDDQLSGRLGDEGFDVPSGAWASYTTTQLVLPSVFDMDYVASEWVQNGATVQHLYDKISGENAFLDVLIQNGYESEMIESGWSGGTCGRLYNSCFGSPLYDEAFNRLLHRSVLAELPFSLPGLHFTIGTKATMRHLLTISSGPPNRESPRFVFAHLLAPHPPFFLDSECSVVTESGREGFFYPLPDVPPAERDAYFRQSLNCVDDFLVDFVRTVDQEDVVIVFSDHGTGRRAQMAREPQDWDSDALRERFGALTAVRMPGCPLTDPLLTVNLLRTVIACLSESDLHHVPSRMFLGPGIEVEPDVVKELVGLG